MITKVCLSCNKEFITDLYLKKYCTKVCKLKVERTKRKNTYQRQPPIPSRNCKGCNKIFNPKSKANTYCSGECCKVNNFYIPRWKGIETNCKLCNLVFVQNSPNQKYCSSECCKAAILSKRTFIPTTVECIYCNEKYIKIHPCQKYCTIECRDSEHKQKQKLVTCSICHIEFSTKHGTICSNKCRAVNLSNFARARLHSTQIVTQYTDINSLWFVTENDFAEWFKHNYSWFGIDSIVYMDRLFPDVIAMADNKQLNIELELHSSNFAIHGHNPFRCDLIISFTKLYGQEKVNGIPVLSVFNVINRDPSTKTLTSVFSKMISITKEHMKDILR